MGLLWRPSRLAWSCRLSSLSLGGLAVFYLLLIVALRRNEYRADEEAAKVLGPDHLIEVFKDFDSDPRYAGGSESHPPPKKRIRRLRRLFPNYGQETS